jgi:hypothetical protein
METKKRKRRNDCNHAVYVITNTVTQEQYVGVTVVASTVKHNLKVRMQKHIRRALTENRDWALCKSIREHGAEAFTYGVLAVVRGRAAGYALERELIIAHSPSLNTF